MNVLDRIDYIIHAVHTGRLEDAPKTISEKDAYGAWEDAITETKKCLFDVRQAEEIIKYLPDCISSSNILSKTRLEELCVDFEDTIASLTKVIDDLEGDGWRSLL